MKRSAPLARTSELRSRSRLPAKSKKPGYAHQKKALDALCRQIVFKRDPKCQRCGKVENGQWCHVSSRRYIALRWRLENSLRLCAGCHLWWHHRPLEAVTWFKATFPQRAHKIELLSSVPQKVDLELERLYLEAEAAK